MAGYKLNLMNEKLVLYNRISKLIIVIFFVFFCYLAIFSEYQSIRIKSIGTIILLSVGFAFQFYFRNTKFKIGNRPFFLLIALGWISIENYWLAGIALVFDIFSSISSRRLDVYVAKDGIRYPAVPSKKLKWDELSRVILKDGLLTIDFKSNKLIQQMTDLNNTSIDEKEFNDFCKQQLNK